MHKVEEYSNFQDIEYFNSLPEAHQNAIIEANVSIKYIKQCNSVESALEPGDILEMNIQFTFIREPEQPKKPSNSLADWFEHVYQGKPRQEEEPETRCLAGYSINIRRE